MRGPFADRPVIVEAALNGGRTKGENPHVPRSTDELIADALACLDAGASVIHTHAHDPSADAAWPPDFGAAAPAAG